MPTETTTQLPVLREPSGRDQIGHVLQATLHELVNLSLIAKQLHWAVVGPGFRSLHLELDELADSWRELADVVAERAVALGFIPDGQAKAVAAGSRMVPVDPEPIEDHRVVWELTTRVVEISEIVRARIDRIGPMDVVSQDVLIEVVRKLEGQQWMLRAQLVGRS